MIDLIKTLKAAQTRANQIYTAAEAAYKAAVAARQTNPAAPDPVHPSDVCPVLPAIGQAITQAETALRKAAVAQAHAQVDVALSATAPPAVAQSNADLSAEASAKAE